MWVQVALDVLNDHLFLLSVREEIMLAEGNNIFREVVFRNSSVPQILSLLLFGTTSDFGPLIVCHFGTLEIAATLLYVLHCLSKLNRLALILWLTVPAHGRCRLSHHMLQIVRSTSPLLHFCFVQTLLVLLLHEIYPFSNSLLSSRTIFVELKQEVEIFLAPVVVT